MVKVDGKKVAERRPCPVTGPCGSHSARSAAGEHEISVLVRKGTYTMGSTASETINVS